ncbi:MAG: hypothetical protein SPG36_07410 [Eggerthellaceae bacterium]|nr:hypothetical protein [Eggerthellaceae bacterium]
MSFVDVKFSKWGGVATAILSQSLVKRFARVMLAAVLAVSFLPVAAFADEGEVEDVPAGNEAVGQPAVPDQPAATESEDPAGSDQPAATESGVPAESDQPAATEPEAPAESEAQPAATELEAFADQPDTEDGSNDKQKSGGDSELKGIKGKKDPIFWYEITSYQNLTKRSSYDWSWEKDGETGAITVTETDDPSRVTVTGTEIGSVILKVSGGDLGEETIRIEIRKRTVGLSSSYGEKIYDGTPLTVVGINEDGEGWIDADKGRVKYKMTGSQTNAGVSDNTFDVEFPSGSEEYFKEHYAITISYAPLNVAQRPVTLTSASGSKEYDGKPLTNDDVIVGGDGWANGEGATYDVTGKQTLVGESPNTFSYILNEGTKADNYDIKTEFGTLTVTDRSAKYEITLTPNSKSETYDGTEKSVSGFETLEFKINDQTFNVSGVEASAKGTNAGEYPVTVSGQAVVTDADDNDVTSQFTVNVVDGAKLVIVKRQVSATGEGFDNDQPYTGKEYSKTGCTFSNLVDGQEASITYALRGTGIGTYEGVFGDDFKVMADGKDVTANYELVEKVPGKLTIVEGDPDTPVDPDKPSSDKTSKTTGKTTATKATAAKPASKSAKTGDGIALYAMGICAVAIVAGAVAFVARRKRNSDRQPQRHR